MCGPSRFSTPCFYKQERAICFDAPYAQFASPLALSIIMTGWHLFYFNICLWTPCIKDNQRMVHVQNKWLWNWPKRMSKNNRMTPSSQVRICVKAHLEENSCFATDETYFSGAIWCCFSAVYEQPSAFVLVTRLQNKPNYWVSGKLSWKLL